MDAEPHAAERDDEDEQRERYRELLEELRTIIPGVQVLFAFLITVPFSSRFTELDQLGVRVFLLALVTVGLAAVVLLTPAAYHRLTPRHDRRQRIKLGVRVTISGMVLLAIAIGCAVFVVARLILSTSAPLPAAFPDATPLAAAAAALIAGTAAGLWFIVPFIRRER